MIDLKDKIINWPDGRKFYFLTSKPVVGNSERNICLLNTLGKKADYYLWFMEVEDEKTVSFWPYEGTDSEELIKELLENFIETAYTQVEQK